MNILLAIGVILGVFDTFIVYCCAIAGKRADEKNYAEGECIKWEPQE